MPQDALAGGEDDIGGDEAAGAGVVVTGLEIVEGGLGVIDVAAVAEGLVGAQGRGKGAGGGEKFAPAIVGVLYYRCAGRVNELDYIPLRIADIVVLRAVVGDGNGIAGGIVIMLHNRSIGRCYGAIKVLTTEASFLFKLYSNVRSNVNDYLSNPLEYRLRQTSFEQFGDSPSHWITLLQ